MPRVMISSIFLRNSKKAGKEREDEGQKMRSKGGSDQSP